MLNFKSHATAALCASGLAAATLAPLFQFPVAPPAVTELALAEVQSAGEGEFVGELPVSVVTSNFDLASTDASQFGDLDLD